MITSLVAHTFEVDDIGIAVSEILEQLDLGSSLRKNSVGIITCHCEFLYSGVVKALSDKFPLRCGRHIFPGLCGQRERRAGHPDCLCSDE